MAVPAEQVKKAVVALLLYVQKHRQQPKNETRDFDQKKTHKHTNGRSGSNADADADADADVDVDVDVRVDADVDIDIGSDSDSKHRQHRSVLPLFDEEDSDVFLHVVLKKMPEKERVKPILIPVPHSIYGRDGSEICLLTKDPEDFFKQKLDERPVDNVTGVIGISRLRKDFRQYEDKRKLLASYRLFLADDRILPLLPPLLGSKFFEKKRHPVPVRISGKSFQNELMKARDSAILYAGGSAQWSIRIGRSSFSPQHLSDNVVKAIPSIVNHAPRKWKNIQGIYLKTDRSVSLPLYNSLPVNRFVVEGLARGAADIEMELKQSADDEDMTPKSNKNKKQNKNKNQTENKQNQNNKKNKNQAPSASAPSAVAVTEQQPRKSKPNGPTLKAEVNPSAPQQAPQQQSKAKPKPKPKAEAKAEAKAEPQQQKIESKQKQQQQPQQPQQPKSEPKSKPKPKSSKSTPAHEKSAPTTRHVKTLSKTPKALHKLRVGAKSS